MVIIGELLRTKYAVISGWIAPIRRRSESLPPSVATRTSSAVGDAEIGFALRDNAG